MNKANIAIDRKVLADIAVNDPQAFQAIAQQAKVSTNWITSDRKYAIVVDVYWIVDAVIL